MLATAPIMVTESKLATTDATLTLWLVGGQCCLWELSRRPSAGFAAGFWGLMALAILTKGPVGPALIAVAGLVSWWWGGPTACWRRLRWRWGPLLFLLLTAPWFVAVGLISHGEFFRFALGNQVINRVASGMEEHGGFPGYYILTSLGMFHPWSAFVPAALLAAWTRRGTQPAFGFLLGWVVGPLILLECVRTKLVHYYLPAYPACALLAAWLVLEVVKDEVNLRRYPLGRLAFGLLGGVGIGASVALIALAMVVPAHAALAEPGAGGPHRRGDDRRDGADLSRGDREGGDRPGRDLGSDPARDRRLAPAVAGALPDAPDRRRAARGPVADTPGPARPAHLPGAERDLRGGPPRAGDQDMATVRRAAPDPRRRDHATAAPRAGRVPPEALAGGRGQGDPDGVQPQQGADADAPVHAGPRSALNAIGAPSNCS